MKATIFKITAIMLLLAVAITGCDRSPVEIPECECDIIIECYADDDAYKAVDSEINIGLAERFDVYPRTFQMGFSTRKIFPCFNYWIDLSWQKSSNTIDVVFNSVGRYDICFTALGPATAGIDFGALSIGTYQLNFRNGQIRCSGKLIVSADSYTIIFPENSAFNIRLSSLNKIPKQTIWGLVGYHKEETRPLVDSFFTALMELGATKRSFTPGYYTAFTIDENGNIIPPTMHGFWFAEPFIFHYAGDTADLDDFLKQWAYKYRAYTSITINTYRGERFMSWMYWR